MQNRQTNWHSGWQTAENWELSFFSKYIPFLSGSVFLRDSLALIRWPASSLVLYPAERDSHRWSLRNSRLQLHNRLGSDGVCMLKDKTLSRAGFVNGGGWNVWYDWWYHRHTDLLFVNPGKNKQSPFVAQCELWRLCNQIKQEDKHKYEHSRCDTDTNNQSVKMWRLQSSLDGLQSNFSTLPVMSEEAL